MCKLCIRYSYTLYYIIALRILSIYMYYTLYNTHIHYNIINIYLGYFTGICAFIWAIFGTLFGIFYEKWSVLQSIYFAVGAMSGRLVLHMYT